MANSDAPTGLKPVKHGNGAPYNGAANKYYLPTSDTTATFIGDAVKSGGSADSRGIPSVAQAAAGDAIRGVVVGFEPNRDDLTQLHRPASQERYVYVCDAPDVIFEIQEDSVTSTLAAASVGLNADIVVAAGSTSTGLSAMELDSNTAATGTAQLRILGLADREDNEIGANAKWLVRINEHELTQATGV